MALTEDSETAVSIQKVAGRAVQHTEVVSTTKGSVSSFRRLFRQVRQVENLIFLVGNPVDIYLITMTNDDSSDDEVDGPHWSTKNRQVTYEQGNRVLEAQKDDINDLDDKALRTVRITALLIGVAATGLQAVNDLTVNDTTAGIGLVSLFISLTFGVLTYSESSEIVGPTADYVNNMRDGRRGTDWEVDLLLQLPGWISRNQEKVERNALLFTFCQLTLVVGVGFGAASLIPVSPLDATFGILVVGVIVIIFWLIAAIKASRDHPN